jgi:hypothetical protein
MVTDGVEDRTARDLYGPVVRRFFDEREADAAAGTTLAIDRLCRELRAVLQLMADVQDAQDEWQALFFAAGNDMPTAGEFHEAELEAANTRAIDLKERLAEMLETGVPGTSAAETKSKLRLLHQLLASEGGPTVAPA